MKRISANRLLTGLRLTNNGTANKVLTDIIIKIEANKVYISIKSSVLLAVLALKRYKSLYHYKTSNTLLCTNIVEQPLYKFTANTANTANTVSKIKVLYANTLALLLLTEGVN